MACWVIERGAGVQAEQPLFWQRAALNSSMQLHNNHHHDTKSFQMFPCPTQTDRQAPAAAVGAARSMAAAAASAAATTNNTTAAAPQQWHNVDQPLLWTVRDSRLCMFGESSRQLIGPIDCCN